MARVVVNRIAAHAWVMSTSERLVQTVTAQVLIESKIAAASGPYATGRLASTIHAGFRTTQSGHESTVGSNLWYAKLVEKGAQAHIIRARPKGLGGGTFSGGHSLHFYWRRVGRYVSFRKVNHPGFRGKEYIEDALRNAARRHGLRVVIYDV